MVSGINSKRLKVVWLCHFANEEMKNYFGTPHVAEMAPWINNLIQIFQDRTDIELYVVAPNLFTNRDSRFEKNEVSYFFYKRIPLPTNNKYVRGIYSLLKIDEITNYNWVKRKIVNVIQKIDPDIIHLHGAENPYYSAGILPVLKQYPTLITIQGFIRSVSKINYNIKKRIEIEEAILKGTKHIGVRTDEMSEMALEINPRATLHIHNYPIAIPTLVKTNIGKEEPIDCLFFARVTKDKGIEDLLKAISIVKNTYPKISVSVIGGTSKSYFAYLKTLCTRLSIEDNVDFLGFLPTHEDICKFVLHSKMCVLPTYYDIIPGTIVESMYMKLPIVAYAVGGIPELNRKETTVMLVDKHDINQLAEKIIQVLTDTELRKELADKAYIHVHERFDNSKVANDIINAYQSILEENFL